MKFFISQYRQQLSILWNYQLLSHSQVKFSLSITTSFKQKESVLRREVLLNDILQQNRHLRIKLLVSEQDYL